MTVTARLRSVGFLRTATALLLTAGAAGCAGNVYRAGKVPAEYLAQSAANVQTVDLSKLATPTVSSQLIERGDLLHFTLSTGYNDGRVLPMPVRVGDDGVVNLPLIGPVPIAGLQVEVAEQAIAATAVERGIYRNPHVTLAMKKQRVNRVTVIGAVNKPGVYELNRGASGLLSAIVAAGGLAKDAGTDVDIQRPALLNQAQDGRQLAGVGPDGQTMLASYNAENPSAPESTSQRVDLTDAAGTGKDKYVLSDGDVVMVSKRAPNPIQVIGLVRRPGVYDIPFGQDLRVLDALAMAGGWTSPVANKVHVIRKVPGRDEPVVISVSMQEAKSRGQGNLILTAGDTVSVEQTPATIAVDTVQRFMRFSVSGNQFFN